MIKAKEDTFHLGVKALIRNPNKEILLLERKSKFNKNYWDIPGGRLQKGESLLQTLKQEIAEETGFIQYAIHDYPISLIGLDTHVMGKDSGNICEERFAWVKKVNGL